MGWPWASPCGACAVGACCAGRARRRCRAGAARAQGDEQRHHQDLAQSQHHGLTLLRIGVLKSMQTISPKNVAPSIRAAAMIIAV